MVGRAKELGFLIGSCSDRYPSARRAPWETREIEVDFAAEKHVLSDVKERCEAEIYFIPGTGAWTKDCRAGAIRVLMES